MLRKGHILVILVIAVSFVTVNEAYGITVGKCTSSTYSTFCSFLIPLEDKKPAGSDRMDWGIIFVTSFNDCSDRNWQALNFYSYIARQSIQQYGYPSAIIFADCISKNDYLGNIKQYQDYMDLPIFVLDYAQSMEQRHSTNSLGHYSAYSVTNIVTQAETFSIENQDTAWTLSHEIAHSSLHWLNYDRNVWVDYVHNIQKAYDICKSKGDYAISLGSCQPLWTTVKSPDRISYAIMSLEPYLEQQEIKDKETLKRIEDKKLQEEKLRDYLADLEKRIEDEQKRFREIEIKKSTAERLEREKQKESLYQDRYRAVERESYRQGYDYGYQYPNSSNQPKESWNPLFYVEPERTDEQQAYYDAQEQFKLNRQLKQWEDERKLQLENNPIPEHFDFVLVDPKETNETQKPAEPDYFSDFIIQIQDFFSSLRWG